MAAAQELIVVYWEWTAETKHAGARFWGCHARDNDARIRDWPKIGLQPLGAATVTVREGEGLDLLGVICGARSECANEIAECLKDVLAHLVAATSLIARAEDIKRRPSRAVASDAMFAQMIQDYEAAISRARAALTKASA